MLKRGTVLLAVLAALAAGCGDDDDGGDSADPQAAQTQTEAEQEAPAAEPGGGAEDPAAAVQQLQASLADGDAAAVCGLLSESGVRQAADASIGGSCEDWAEEFSGVFDDATKEKLRNTEILDVAESGDTATVEYQSPILDFPVEAELERSDGGWKISKLAEGV